MPMRHKVLSIDIKLNFEVMGRRGRLELENVHPDIVFGDPKVLQEMIDEGIDKFLVQDAMNNAPANMQG